MIKGVYWEKFIVIKFYVVRIVLEKFINVKEYINGIKIYFIVVDNIKFFLDLDK